MPKRGCCCLHNFHSPTGSLFASLWLRLKARKGCQSFNTHKKHAYLTVKDSKFQLPLPVSNHADIVKQKKVGVLVTKATSYTPNIKTTPLCVRYLPVPLKKSKKSKKRISPKNAPNFRSKQKNCLFSQMCLFLEGPHCTNNTVYKSLQHLHMDQPSKGTGCVFRANISRMQMPASVHVLTMHGTRDITLYSMCSKTCLNAC